jgi:Subtilase family
MVIRFDDADPGRRYSDDDRSAVPELPQHLLERHGARVLNPANALVAGDPFPAPRSTVYRAGSMLMPVDVFRENINAFNQVLSDGKTGMKLLPPKDNAYDRYGRFPRSVALRAAEDTEKPAQVDSWLALQTLRVAAARGRLDPRLVGQVSVEHLMFGTVDIGGSPWEASGGIGGAPWEASGGGGYVRGLATGRIPVALRIPAPPRGNPDRRPVVAVLDTGIGPHEWFGFTTRVTPPASSFIKVWPALQNAIQQQGENASLTTPTRVLTGFWDTPVTDNPLIGTLDRDSGHGTFIAGIVHQAAPEADVLAIRVMHSDGVAYESDVLLALWALVDRVSQAQQNGDLDNMVDVVSLSLGYFDESGSPSQFTGQLLEVIDRLRDLGVLVFAAAGNDATSRPFYPAAFAELASGGSPQVVSVGALNPNSTKALFSNEASWVRAWATGAGVVSTFPMDVQGSIGADFQPATRRASLDQDDFRSGFAVWDGTSFAAPLLAAEVTANLLASAADDPALALKAVDRETTVKRAWAALKKTGFKRDA